MLKNSFGKGQTGIWMTILGLILCGSYYFFIYMPANELTVQERRFRCLRKIDKSIHEKIENSKVLITTVARDYYNLAIAKKNNDRIKIEHYIQNNSKRKFTLLLPEKAYGYYNSPNLRYIGDDKEGNKFYIEASTRLTLLVKTASEKKFSDGNNSNDKKDLKIRLIGIQFEFDQFLKPLLPSDVFDQFAVFIDHEKVFEDYPSGLSFNDPDSLLNVRNKVSTPGCRNLRIGAADYKVFSHPVYSFVGIKWIISGLLKNEKYQQEKGQLPSWVLLLLLTLVIVILVSLPWIKLYHMGNKDRLTINDGIASILVSIFLMSLIFFIFFKYISVVKQPHWLDSENSPYVGDNYSSDKLASAISNAFLTEITATCHLIDVFKNNDKFRHTDITLLGKKQRGVDSLFNRAKGGLDINEIFWLNKFGRETSELTTDSMNTPRGNYQNRDYFTSPENYRIANHLFGFEPVISYTSGTFRSIFSKNNNSSGDVIAISCNLKSVGNVSLPAGYQFAIVNNGGWVLYHSKSDRNLFERLQQEFSNHIDLQSSLVARSNMSFRTIYYGKSYNVRVKPIQGQRFFVVIFEDSEFNDSRDTEAYVFTFGMLICMMVFIVLNYLIVFIVSSKRSFFKKQHMDTSWIGPHLSSHHQYNIAIIGNLVIILLLIVYFNHSTFLTFLYLLLLSVIFSSLFLNITFTIKYQHVDTVAYQRKNWGNAALIVLAILINFLAFSNLEHWGYYFSFDVLVFIFCGVLLLLEKHQKLNLVNARMKRFFGWDYANSYALMTSTRLIITSGIPVAFFFMYSFNYEQILNTRYKQMGFASTLSRRLYVDFQHKKQHLQYEKDKKALRASIDSFKNDTVSFPKGTNLIISNTLKKKKGDLEKLKQIDKQEFQYEIREDNQKLDSLTTNKTYYSGIYPDGLFVNNIHVLSHKDLTGNLVKLRTRTREESITLDLLRMFRFLLNDTEINEDHLYLSESGPATFTSLFPRLSDNSPVRTYYKLDEEKYLVVSSIGSITYPHPHIIFWLLLGVGVFVYHFVILSIIRRLFSLNRYSTNGWRQMDDYLLEQNFFNQMVFVVGSPGANSIEKLTLKINNGKIKRSNGTLLNFTEVNASPNSVFIVDMMIIPTNDNIPDANWDRHKKIALAGHGLIIIDHFEYNINDPIVSKLKLDFLELVMERKNTKVVIISTMHPVIFLNSFSEHKQAVFPDSEIGRWHSLLGKFRVIIDPLVASAEKKGTNSYDQKIIDETQYSRFLHRMQKTFRRFLAKGLNSQQGESKNYTTDSLIFKLQLTSQYFYTDIWQSLTIEEKFLLYDLSEDGLVNSYDDFNLSMLICKGLIVQKDGVLSLFNTGFRNFIMTSIGVKELENIRAHMKNNSKWSNLKTPLILTISAILIFLFASQQEEYSRIITYIAAFGAGLSTILKIFSLFNNSGSNVQKTA